MLIKGASGSPLRGGPRLGLLRIGGGDRNLGDTGHRGDSRRWSNAVGDFIGTGALMFGSDMAGRRVGVFVDERILEVEVEDVPELFGRVARGGLVSCRLFFRDLVPGFVDEARELAVRERGRVGDVSREGRGEGAADVGADGAQFEFCEVNLDGHESVLGVTVWMLDVDSRDSVGYRCRALPALPALPSDFERLASDESPGMLGELSMFGYVVRSLREKNGRLSRTRPHMPEICLSLEEGGLRDASSEP